MESLFGIFLVVHILSGSVGLLMGSLAMMLKKGSDLHKLMGRIFLMAMTGIFISSLYMSIAIQNWFLLCIGFFSFFLAASGYRILSLKPVKAFEHPASLTDHIIAWFGMAAGVGMMGLAVLLFSRSNSFGIVPSVFGVISFLLAYRGYRSFGKSPSSKDHWVRSHGLRMGGAFTAMVTAFVVVNIQIGMQWILWLLPTTIIIPLTMRQVRSFLRPVAKG
ncbi:MAG TPA: hypothetical protein VK907_14920 [Phnomibacter sp.]|nr:hypothetical protein [Phnomibacter sp.]